MYGENAGQYLTYQHNTQAFFRDHREKYDGIIVPLSIATAFRHGTGGFILTLKKPFAIDPRTPLFQARFSRDDLRPTHLAMAEIHGSAVADVIEDRELRPGDFSAGSLEEMVEGVVEFQQTFAETSKEKVGRYARLLGESPEDSYEGPAFIIPPYFIFEDTSDPWYDVSLRAARHGSECAGGDDVAAVMHFPISLPEAEMGDVVEEYAHLPCQGLILYVNIFQEGQQAVADLSYYVRIVRLLAETGKPVMALFGGYFTAILRTQGLRVFSNGVGYGEYRDSGYHAGGQAWKRYYLPALHRYLPVLDAEAVLDLLPDDSDLWLTTPLIDEALEAGGSLHGLDQATLLSHFMECRDQELQNIREQDINELREELENTADVFDDVPLLGDMGRHHDHLSRWLEALESV